MRKRAVALLVGPLGPLECGFGVLNGNVLTLLHFETMFYTPYIKLQNVFLLTAKSVNLIQLSATDLLALPSMKNAAKCDN